MSSDAEQSEAERRAESKRRYEGVIGTIRHNTGGPAQASPDRPGIGIAHILANRTQAGEPHKKVKDALRRAVSEDDVVSYRNPEGMTRYAVADAVGLRAVALERGMDTVAEAVGVPVLADCDPTADAVGACIDTHIGERIAPDDLPLLNALQQGLREAEDG